jgi:SAM-dependent methyltransferase
MEGVDMILAGSRPDAECPLCKERVTIPKRGYQHIMPGDWSLAECLRCGTAFIFPMPDASTLARYYDENYYGPGEHKLVGPAETISWVFRYLRARLVRKSMPMGRILDVGCGRGVMLKVLKRWGHEVDGIELDTVAARRAEKNTGQRIYHSLEELAAGAENQYEVISFWHSLEHIPDLYRTLQLVHRLLAPEGFLIIAAPNMASIQASLSGRTWLHLDLPRHLTHFAMPSLALFLESQGYRLLRHDHFSQEYNPIDTLCYLCEILGFGNLYPFRIITRSHQGETEGNLNARKKLLFCLLLPPLTIVASMLANLFSLFRSGSTSTLILQRWNPSLSAQRG